MIKLDVTKKI